jgi:hypothetical protein
MFVVNEKQTFIIISLIVTFFSNNTVLLMKITNKFPRATEKYHMDIDTVFIESGAWKINYLF